MGAQEGSSEARPLWACAVCFGPGTWRLAEVKITRQPSVATPSTEAYQAPLSTGVLQARILAHSKVTPTRMLVVLRLRNAAPHAARLSHTLGGIDYHDLCLASAVLGVPHATEDI